MPSDGDKQGSVWKQSDSNLMGNSVDGQHLITIRYTWITRKKTSCVSCRCHTGMERVTRIKDRRKLWLTEFSFPFFLSTSQTVEALSALLQFALTLPLSACQRQWVFQPQLSFNTLLLTHPSGYWRCSRGHNLFADTRAHAHTHCLSSTSLAASWPSNTAAYWSRWIPRRRLRVTRMNTSPYALSGHLVSYSL